MRRLDLVNLKKKKGNHAGHMHEEDNNNLYEGPCLIMSHNL